jgi:hypothetical protein
MIFGLLSLVNLAQNDVLQFHYLLENNKISFFYMAEKSKYHTFLIHSSVVGHLGCFHNLAIVTSTAINMGVQVPLEYPVLHSFGYQFSSKSQ